MGTSDCGGWANVLLQPAHQADSVVQAARSFVTDRGKYIPIMLLYRLLTSRSVLPLTLPGNRSPRRTAVRTGTTGSRLKILGKDRLFSTTLQPQIFSYIRHGHHNP